MDDQIDCIVATNNIFLGPLLLLAVLPSEGLAQPLSTDYFRRANPGPIAVPAPSQKDGSGNSYELVRYQASLERFAYRIVRTTPSGVSTTYGQLLPFGPIAVSTAGTVFILNTSEGITWVGSTGVSYPARVSGDAFSGSASALSFSVDDLGWVYQASSPTATTSPLYVYVPDSATTPRIFSQPVGGAFSGTGSVSLSVLAVGRGALSYQWQNSGVAIAGATSSAYSASTAGNYSVVVSQGSSSITSASAVVGVPGPPSGSTAVAPVIVTQPIALNANAGASATFSVSASGTPLFNYQWRKNGVAINAANQSVLTLDNLQASDAGNYSVDVGNSVRVVSSSAAVLTVNLPPTISVGVKAQTVIAGATAVFDVTANSNLALSYQWLKNGERIVGATNASFRIENVQPASGAVYTVVVSNAAGLFSLSDAILSVNFSRLVNLSTRALVPSGGAMSPGFVLRGSGSKRLVIRGIGPTLSAFGVSGLLADPKLELFQQGSTATIQSNDDWNGSDTLTSAFARLGAFPLDGRSKDTALLADLAVAGTSPFSARITQSAAIPGIALAEVYDADPLGSSAYLVNLSTFAFVGTGENLLSAGFVIRGNIPKRLLIRAIGPGLSAFGAVGLLSDPQLQVIDANGVVVASNSDWGGTVALKTAFAQAGAFQIPDISSDAAVVVQLNPGTYTVQVTGVGNTTGNALVEVYDLDP